MEITEELNLFPNAVFRAKEIRRGDILTMSPNYNKNNIAPSHSPQKGKNIPRTLGTMSTTLLNPTSAKEKIEMEINSEVDGRRLCRGECCARLSQFESNDSI